MSISRLHKTALSIPQAYTIRWGDTVIRICAHQTTIKAVCLTQPLPTATIFTRPVQVTIQVQEALPFAPGRSVERMGHHGWRGRITAVEGDKAHVNWGGSRQWLDLSELYPLDEQGRPVPPGRPPDLLEAARRARVSLKDVEIG